MRARRFLFVCILLLIPAFSVLFGAAGPSSQAGAAPLERSGEKEFAGKKGSLKVRVSETEISIADSLSLSVEVVVPEGFAAALPSFREFGFSTDFNERSQRFRATDVSPVEEITLDDGSTLLRRQFTLEPWLSGDYAIPPLMISYYENDSGAEDSSVQFAQAQTGREDADPARPGDWRVPAFYVMSDGIRVQVTGLGEERQELSDLFGQADLSLDRLAKKERRKEDKSDQELRREEEEKQEAAKSLAQKEFPWWILYVFLAGGLIAPLVWYFGRSRIGKFFAKPARPAHEIAYQALEELRAKDLPARNMIKEFYYELSYILREYIGGRFRIFAVNQTTEEFFQQLLNTKNPFDHKSEEILRLFSEHADSVKYSQHRPAAERARESLDVVRSFVDATREREETPSKGGANND